MIRSRVGLYLLLALCLTWVPALNGQDWASDGPLPRISQSVVFDPSSKQMIIFGGQWTNNKANLNDVWFGQTFATLGLNLTQLVPTGTPPQGRYGHVATYDSANNRMTVFGGATGLPSPCVNDVWVLDKANGQAGTATWIPLAPSGSAPPARYRHAAAYDAATNTLIAFGGSNCSTGYFNDVWLLSNANGMGGSSTWTQLTIGGSLPAARESATVVFDATNNILILYGGDAGGSPFSDVWVLSNANGHGGTPAWSQLAVSGTAPAARTGHTSVYDVTNNRMIAFGGGSLTSSFADTWILKEANGRGGTPTWSKLSSTGTAPNLQYHSAVYDASANNMYVFGGSSTTQSKLQASNHAFTLQKANGLVTGSAWFVGGIPVRYAQSTFYDPGSNSLFVYGGQHAFTNGWFGDYWQAKTLVGSTALNWTIITTGTGPGKRSAQLPAYDTGTNRLMLFGGNNGYPAVCFNDFWVLKNANNSSAPKFVSVKPAGTAPSPRRFQSGFYDPGSNVIVVFGGNDCKSGYFNDVWVLSSANSITGAQSWTNLLPQGTPPSARESSSVVYDAANNVMIVYGGDAGGTPFGDIWLLSHANGSGGTPVWSQLDAGAGPVPRAAHVAVYDAANNLMIMEGGFDGTNILSDTWRLSGANGRGVPPQWTQVITTTQGPTRRFHSAVYDPGSNEMVIFGGATSLTPQNPSADLWVLTNANGKR